MATSTPSMQAEQTSRNLLESEYAFARQATTSVKAAFLDFLADDSWTLQPEPLPARIFYAAAPERKNILQRYPTVADLAPSGDLGFTTGPWMDTDAANVARVQGDYVTVWQRNAATGWRIAVDGRITHKLPDQPEPALRDARSSIAGKPMPPAQFPAEDDLTRLIGSFRIVAQQDGAASALRAYARNDGFRLLTDGELPIDGPGPASKYLAAHKIAGAWRELAQGRSTDSTFAYSLGKIIDVHKHLDHAFLQIWEYDPKVSTWAVRLLLVNAL